MQLVMPYLQEDFPVANKATCRTHDVLHYKAANLLTVDLTSLRLPLFCIPSKWSSNVEL